MGHRVTGRGGAVTGLLVALAVVSTQATHPVSAVFLGIFAGGMGWLLGRQLDSLRLSSVSLALVPILAVSFAAVLVALSHEQIRRQYLLRADGVQAEAIVIKERPLFARKGDWTAWRYDTPKGQMTGFGVSDGRTDALVPGDRIEITYSRSEPEVATARAPTETWASDIAVAFAEGLFGASSLIAVGATMHRALLRRGSQ